VAFVRREPERSIVAGPGRHLTAKLPKDEVAKILQGPENVLELGHQTDGDGDVPVLAAQDAKQSRWRDTCLCALSTCSSASPRYCSSIRLSIKDSA
jgi:hypothetical protein